MPEYRKRASRRAEKLGGDAPTTEEDVESVHEAPSTAPLKDTVSLGTPTPVRTRPDRRPKGARGVVPTTRIRNNTGQLVTCSVLSEDGRVQQLRLFRHATSNPVPVAHVTDYTKSMVASGTLSLVR